MTFVLASMVDRLAGLLETQNIARLFLIPDLSFYVISSYKAMKS